MSLEERSMDSGAFTTMGLLGLFGVLTECGNVTPPPEVAVTLKTGYI